MRILFKDCIYNTSNKTTINYMLKSGGKEILPQSINDNEIEKEKITISKPRGRKKKIG